MKKIFILMFVMVLLVGTVSAAEWDNGGRYNKETKTMTIKNGCDPFGLVCFGDDIAEAKLLTPQNNKVPVGKNILVAEFEVKGFLDYDDFFSSLEMFDIKNNFAKDNRVYDIKIRYNESYQVNDYGRECSLDPQSKNGTSICQRVKVGSHIEYRESWKDLAPQDLKQNSVLYVGIFTEVRNADHVEWIPTLFGVKIDEWAEFSATGGTVTFRDIGGLNFSVHTFTTNGTFTVTGSGVLTEVLIVAGGGAGGGNAENIAGGGGAGGLVFAENLSISSGDFPIVVGIGGLGLNGSFQGNNGTNSSAFGLIANGGGGGGGGAAAQTSGADGGSGGGSGWSTTIAGISTQGNFSNATGFGNGGGSGTSGAEGGGGGGGANESGTDGNSTGGNNGGRGGPGNTHSINGTSTCYAGGGGGGGDTITSEASCGGGRGGRSFSAGSPIGTGGFGINGTGGGGGGSSFGGSGQNATGGDGGSGIVVILFLPGEAGPTVTLNSPVDFFNSTNSTIDFNGSVFSPRVNAVTNVSLFIDGVINETNSSGINNTNYLFTKILSDGIHNWTYETFDNESGSTIATTRTFTINTTPNIDYISPTPINGFNSTEANLTVNISLTEDFFLNLTIDLYNVNGALNRTITFTNSTREANFAGLEDATFSYNATTFTTTGQSNFTETRNISIDATAPTIIVTSPTGDQGTFTSGLNLSLIWNASDINIDTCQFDYESVNTTVNCNNTEIGLVVTNSLATSLTFYVNDTFGTVNFNSTSWTYSFIENNITFNPDVFETESQFFQINLSTSLNVSAISAQLNYNGTNFISSAACDVFCLVNNTIDIPLVTEGEFQNKSFFWEINIFNGTDSVDVNTSSTEQNVTRIHLEECNGGFTVEALNFTVYDEQNLSRIDPFLFDGDFEQWLGSGDVKRQSNFSQSSTSDLDLCITPEETFFIDATIEYDEAGNESLYTLRNYYFQNDTISNVSQDIFMYLLQSSFSTSFILKVQDNALLPVPNVLIETNRFYPGLNEFRIVQIAKTDDLGKSVGFFETEIVDYKFIITFNNDTLLETGIQKVIPESSPFTLTFNLGESLGEPWSSQIAINDLISTLIWNDLTGIITYNYIDNSTNLTLARLFVIQQSLVNSSADSTICNENSTLTSAILTCDVGNNSGFYTATSFITRDSTETLDLQITFQIETLSAIVGLLGLFYGWFLILIASFMFRFNEIAGIWSITIVVLLVNLIGLINFGGVFVTATLGVAILLTWLMSN